MLYIKLFIEREKNTGQSAPECPFKRKIKTPDVVKLSMLQHAPVGRYYATTTRPNYGFFIERRKCIIAETALLNYYLAIAYFCSKIITFIVARVAG